MAHERPVMISQEDVEAILGTSLCRDVLHGHSGSLIGCPVCKSQAEMRIGEAWRRSAYQVVYLERGPVRYAALAVES